MHAASGDRPTSSSCDDGDGSGISLGRWIAPAFIAAAVLLGGSSSGGLLANAVLQIIAVLSCCWAIEAGVGARLTTMARVPLLLVLLSAVWLMITLLPLPIGLSLGLPGRGGIDAGLDLLGQMPSTLSLSLSPDATVATLAALLPPLAMLLVTLLAPPAVRRMVMVVVVGLALISIVIGIWQQTSGYRADVYLYAISSRGGATGFFANRNHLATLCLMAIPFTVALALTNGVERDRFADGGRRLVASGIVVLLILGTLVVQSLAGTLLLVPTLAACAVMALRQRRHRRSARIAAIAGVVVTVAAIALAAASASKFGATSGEMSPNERRTSIAVTARAAGDYLPFGSGAGSFTSIYPGYEDPTRVGRTFVNHAHDDYVELALELGFPGILLALGFLVWFISATVRAWRRGDVTGQGASIVVAIVLAHELVDYPVRTAAIACVAAFACALLATAVSRRLPRAPSFAQQPERTPAFAGNFRS